MDSADKFCTQCGAPQSAPAPAPVFVPMPPKKAKKKKGLLIALIVVVAVVALAIFARYAVGNYVTLRLHTDKVLRSLNSGNLDLSQFQADPYEDLPIYVIEMMGEPAEPSRIGPVVSAMTPYLSFERVEIHGFFGESEVEYCIVSRDLSQWLLSLDYTTVTSSVQLQEMILDYIPQAPLKEYYVTVKYTKDGSDWKGNYETPAFADAISGGLNTAYNGLYEKMVEEMEALLG